MDDNAKFWSLDLDSLAAAASNLNDILVLISKEEAIEMVTPKESEDGN